MGWKCQVCGKDHGGAEDDGAPLCYEKPECKKKGAFACKWEDEEAPEWTFESGKLTKPSRMAPAVADLNKLISNAGNIYSKSIGTVVGGQNIKKGKKIKGLNDPNARIDIQSPLKSAYNVHYQIGDDSVACVIFTDDDKEAEIFENLRESLKQCKKAVSPSAGAK